MRLQQLAATPYSGAASPVHSSSGLSVDILREAIRTIRRVEEELEVDFLEEPDYDEEEYEQGSNLGSTAPTTPHVVTTRVHLKPSQLRMASWLNSLPLEKYLTWFPDVANTHSRALAIVTLISGIR
jgi:hypothetical protein